MHPVNDLVNSRLDDAVVTIEMDDGKANALSPAMLSALDAALDAAEADDAVSAVVLTGRAQVFSAGFDLNILRGAGEPMVAMFLQGFELAARMLAFPKPIVIASNGHAMAMGSFLLLAGDYRLGVTGAEHRIVANEVTLGIVMPYTAIEICRGRLPVPTFDRAVAQAELFHPDGAVAAGWLDATVDERELAAAAVAKAAALGALDRAAFAGTKLRTRDGLLRTVRAAIDADAVDLRGRYVS